MTRLAVNEIFETLQGEATWTGTPAVFVRLQGCPVGCPWCDTKHTWQLDSAHEIDQAAMLAKADEPAPTHAQLTADELVRVLGRFRSRHVVFTGGEPCMFDLRALTQAIAQSGRQAQIETSGTFPVRCDQRCWVTLSPKIDMPGGLVVLPQAVDRANEIKMPVGKPADVEALMQFLAGAGWSGQPVWLQPLSQSKKATEVCISAAREHGWRVSLQTHKFAGLR